MTMHHPQYFLSKRGRAAGPPNFHDADEAKLAFAKRR
jgi:hypothetical protein